MKEGLVAIKVMYLRRDYIENNVQDLVNCMVIGDFIPKSDAYELAVTFDGKQMEALFMEGEPMENIWCLLQDQGAYEHSIRSMMVGDLIVYVYNDRPEDYFKVAGMGFQPVSPDKSLV